MAACFKLPSLAKRPRPPSQFLAFKWSEVKIEAELGCGTFGSVYLVKYGREDRLGAKRRILRAIQPVVYPHEGNQSDYLYYRTADDNFIEKV